MNKFDSSLQMPSLAINKAVQSDPSVRRLTVLIPDDSDDEAAIGKVWELANVSGSHLRLLSLCKNPVEEPGLRRRLIRMASLLQDGNVSVEWKVDPGSNWVEAVKWNSTPGDMVVCFAEQRDGLWQRPLNQILQSRLRNPVYILAGFVPQDLTRSTRLSQIVAWAGSIGIILGLFLLQIQIMSIARGGVLTTLLILSVFAEASLIGIWNSLLG